MKRGRPNPEEDLPPSKKTKVVEWVCWEETVGGQECVVRFFKNVGWNKKYFELFDDLGTEDVHIHSEKFTEQEVDAYNKLPELSGTYFCKEDSMCTKEMYEALVKATKTEEWWDTPFMYTFYRCNPFCLP